MEAAAVEISEPPSRRDLGLLPRVVALVFVLLGAAAIWALRDRGEIEKKGTTQTRIVPVSSPYKNTAPGVAYVGDEACTRCHAKIAETFRHHPMGRSMTAQVDVMPEVSGTVFELGDLTYSIDRRDGRVFHRETRHEKSGGAEGAGAGEVAKTTEAEVRYLLGSGTRGYSFLVEGDGGLYQSPIAWYAQKKAWDLAPGYRNDNRHFDRKISLECLFCHTNRVEMAAGKPPVFHGVAIGCERCHGPGELHARRPELTDGKDLTIVNPATLNPPALRDSVCEQCHLQGTGRIELAGHSPFDFRPGLLFSEFVNVASALPDPFTRGNAVGQVEQLRQSRCYRESAGQLGCTSCHDPHRLPETSERTAYYRDRCLACHAKQGCSLPAATRRTKSPDDDCTSCHMPPNATSNIAHTAQTVHSIPRNAEEMR
jgi:hypothetical protein